MVALEIQPINVEDVCCVAVSRGAIEIDDAKKLATIFKALADPTRVRLISLIAASENQEACICDLIEPVGLSQPTVSHHMKLLVEAGLIEREQRGKWAFYRLVEGALESLSQVLKQ